MGSSGWALASSGSAIRLPTCMPLTVLGRRTGLPATPLAGPAGSTFLGVWGGERPGEALRGLGREPVWEGPDGALTGESAWESPEGDLVVAGPLVLENALELQRALELPETSPPGLVAELYRRDGLAGLSRLRGMFTLALGDRTRRRLYLLRDGVGARTLYLARRGDRCWFSSRLAILPRCPGISARLSLEALRAYLVFAYVPGEMTMWQDVQELRPGTALLLPEGRRVALWEPGEGPTGEWEGALHAEQTEVGEERLPRRDLCLAENAARLRALLEDAVRLALPERGPAAVYLSGGLDSSLVTALAARLAPGRISTCSIHFGPQYPNELEHSTLVARHCGTPQEVLGFTGLQMVEALPETMAALDDPIGDPLTVPNYLMGQAQRGRVEAVLNGEGGDPCFGGPKNLPMLLHALYEPDQDLATAYLRAYQKCYDDLPQLLSPGVQRELRSAPALEEVVAPLLSGGAQAG
ncbi:MAG: hypothetical protein FJX77_03135, partial [Armatimonadetes bacterium]|nr:hypothetical protein [Armatimonadota bacterium]